MAATEFQYHRPTRRPLRPRAVRPWPRASVRSPSAGGADAAASVSRTRSAARRSGPGAGPAAGRGPGWLSGGHVRDPVGRMAVTCGIELVAEGLALDLGAAEDGREVGDEDQLGGTFVVGEAGGLGEDLVAGACGGGVVRLEQDGGDDGLGSGVAEADDAAVGDGGVAEEGGLDQVGEDGAGGAGDLVAGAVGVVEEASSSR